MVELVVAHQGRLAVFSAICSSANFVSTQNNSHHIARISSLAYSNGEVIVLNRLVITTTKPPFLHYMYTHTHREVMDGNRTMLPVT